MHLIEQSLVIYYLKSEKKHQHKCKQMWEMESAK